MLLEITKNPIFRLKHCQRKIKKKEMFNEFV